MKVVAASQMQAIDRSTIQEYGIPGNVLMSLAGKAVSDYTIANYTDLKKIAIVSGTGNNGGDGFVAAHFLHNRGYCVECFLTGTLTKISDTSRTYYTTCLKEGIVVTELSEDRFPDFSQYDLIIDAMIGTGFSGVLKGTPAKVIEAINSSGKKVLAIDLPSGLTSDGELPQEPVVRADATVTIGLPKISLVTYPGIEYVGKMTVADIGFPRILLEDTSLHTHLIDEQFVRESFRPIHKLDSNKSERGHLLLVGGFKGMEGAIIMSALAALKVGVGYSTLITTEESRKTIAGIIPEMMTIGLNGDSVSDGSASLRNELDAAFKKKRYDAIVIGPGMGRDQKAAHIFSEIMDMVTTFGISRVLIDGDGLFHLVDYLLGKQLPGSVTFVITPHLMEASRLMNCSIDDIKKNRFAFALRSALSTHTITLLKGPRTIVSDGTDTLINTTGNPALATAGTGDILSGIIGAMLLHKIPALYAAGIGAFIHGRAADRYVEQYGTHTMKATDLLGTLEIKIF